MREKIKRWLVEEEMLVEDIPDSDSHFRFLFMFPGDHYMEIVQPLTKPDMVQVISTTSVSEEHQETMRGSNPGHRAEFIWALRFVMNTFFVDFEMVHPDNILEKFTLTDTIFEDGLSKDKLMSVIRKVWKANLQVIWIIQKEYVGLEPKEGEPDTDSGMYR
jgi:hypothetical protein